MKFNTIHPSYKWFPTQRAKIHIWISGRHKEHLYTFELLPKRDPLRFSSYSQGSITTYSSHTPLNLILIHHHSSELHTFLCSPQKHEFFDPLRLSSFSQGSTCTHSPCSPQNFIQIQRRTPELHSTPTQRALIYLWISQISDFAHIHRVAPGHTAHASAPGPIEIQRRTSELESFYWMKRWVHTISNWKRRMTYASDRFTSENSH